MGRYSLLPEKHSVIQVLNIAGMGLDLKLSPGSGQNQKGEAGHD
jgi:hypothetical protein